LGLNQLFLQPENGELADLDGICNEKSTKTGFSKNQFGFHPQNRFGFRPQNFDRTATMTTSPTGQRTLGNCAALRMR